MSGEGAASAEFVPPQLLSGGEWAGDEEKIFLDSFSNLCENCIIRNMATEGRTPMTQDDQYRKELPAEVFLDMDLLIGEIVNHTVHNNVDPVFVYRAAMRLACSIAPDAEGVKLAWRESRRAIDGRPAVTPTFGRKVA